MGEKVKKTGGHVVRIDVLSDQRLQQKACLGAD